MKAPPRSTAAPLFLTSQAMVSTCSSDSTEQGPAIMLKAPPPKAARVFGMRITVSSGWNFRFAFLKGSEIRVTPSTNSSPRIRSMSIRVVSPTRPIIVWNSPSERCVRTPWLSSHWIRCSCSSARMPFFSEIIMFLVSSRKLFVSAFSACRSGRAGNPCERNHLSNCGGTGFVTFSSSFFRRVFTSAGIALISPALVSAALVRLGPSSS